jgi:hypothetical protein
MYEPSSPFHAEQCLQSEEAGRSRRLSRLGTGGGRKLHLLGHAAGSPLLSPGRQRPALVGARNTSVGQRTIDSAYQFHRS